MTIVTITLQDEDQSFLEAAVNSGRYITQSEVVAEALAELKVREEIRQTHRAELKKKIQVGVDQADRGEFVEFNLESFLQERHAAHAASVN